MFLNLSATTLWATLHKAMGVNLRYLCRVFTLRNKSKKGLVHRPYLRWINKVLHDKYMEKVTNKIPPTFKEKKVESIVKWGIKSLQTKQSTLSFLQSHLP